MNLEEFIKRIEDVEKKRRQGFKSRKIGAASKRTHEHGTLKIRALLYRRNVCDGHGICGTVHDYLLYGEVIRWIFQEK